MNFENAHFYIEDLQRILTQYRHLFSNDIIEANGKSLEAVEKQIPKKPFMAPMPGFDGEVASHLSCPGCKMAVVNVWNTDYKPLYCCNCGQRFDWSKEGE